MASKESHPDYGHLNQNKKEKNAVFLQICSHLRQLSKVSDEEFNQFTDGEPRRARSEYLNKLTVKLNELLKTAPITRTFRRLMVNQFRKAYVAGIDEMQGTDLGLFLDGQFSWIFTWSLDGYIGIFDSESAMKFERTAFRQSHDNYWTLMMYLEKVLGKRLHGQLLSLPRRQGTRYEKILDKWGKEFIALHGIDPLLDEKITGEPAVYDSDDISGGYERDKN